ncbi:MAG: glutaredoxin family protein [Rubrivivax sp.]|nr:glutaredoxin family protein [Rubrivivax sp.]
MTPKLVRYLATALLAATALPAPALYKVVQPDGSVTYTDRPPAAGSGRVITLGHDAAPVAPEVVLPLELRQAAQRYPVTLYTSAECTPCDNGRRLLQQRGVPYTERLISSEDDAAALERAVGGRTVPALTIGAQPLRGLSESDWTAFLDAAGYPRESRLPRGWQPSAPTPLVKRMPVRQEPAAAAPAPRAPESPPPAPPPAGTLRF